MSHSDAAKSLRHQVLGAERRGVGRPYPRAVRDAAVAHVSERRSEGVSLAVAAAEIGLPAMTLTRWAAKSAPRGSGFESVQIFEDRPTSLLVVHGPCGLRIEGDVSSLAELLRRLA
jgi:hypothetical protein